MLRSYYKADGGVPRGTHGALDRQPREEGLPRHTTRAAHHSDVMDTVRPIAEIGKHFLPGHARQVVDKGLSAYDSVRKAIKM